MRFGVLFAVVLGAGAALASLSFAQEARAEGPPGSAVMGEIRGAVSGSGNELIPPELTANAALTQAAAEVTDDGASGPVSEAIGTAAEILEPVAESGAPVVQLAGPVIGAGEALLERAGAILPPAAPVIEVVDEVVPVEEVVPTLPESIIPVEPLVPVITSPEPPATLAPILPSRYKPDAVVEPQPQPHPSARLVLPPEVVILAAPSPLLEFREPPASAPSQLPAADVIPNAAGPLERPVAPLGGGVDTPLLLPSSNGSSRAPVPDAPAGAACIATLAVLGALTLSRWPRLAIDRLPHSRVCPQLVPPG